MATPCTGLLGIFVSTSLLLKFFYFVLILQYKQFNCQKLKMKPGPQHGGIDLSTSDQSSRVSRPHPQLLLQELLLQGYLWDLMWWLSFWTTGLWGKSWGRLFISLKRAQKRHFSLLHPVWREAGFQSCTLGKQWGMPVPKTQLLGSWISFVPFPHVHKALKEGKCVIAHKPTFSSLWFFKRLYWDTLCKDLALTTFTPDFSFQPISLSHFILSMQSQSELFIYSRRCSRLYKLAVITEWGARPLAQSSCTGALSCCSTERSPSGEGNDAVPGRRRDHGSNPWAKKQQLIFSTVQSAAWQPQLPNTV